jgi:Lrp/AsnC family transcriptional regulator for asnA, asnC and gidA
MVHQRINRLIEQGILTGIKPVINEKKSMGMIKSLELP